MQKNIKNLDTFVSVEIVFWYIYRYIPIHYSNQSEKVLVPQCVWLCATPWTVAHQPPLSMEFSRQEYWSGWSFLFPGDLPRKGSNPGLLHSRQILYCLSHKGSPNGHCIATKGHCNQRTYKEPTVFFFCKSTDLTLLELYVLISFFLIEREHLQYKEEGLKFIFRCGTSD